MVPKAKIEMKIFQNWRLDIII